MLSVIGKSELIYVHTTRRHLLGRNHVDTRNRTIR